MAPACTVTGAPGRKVSATTLTHLLREEALPRIEGRQWYFCPDADCDVVYFTADSQELSKDALSVRIGVKESGPPRPLCYCFGYAFEDVEREAGRSEESAIAATITEKCRQGLDRCEETNPQGSCCLGNVRRAFQEARQARHRTAGAADAHGCCSTKPGQEGS